MGINEKILLIHGVNQANLIKKLMANGVEIIGLKKISDTEILLTVSLKTIKKCVLIVKRSGYTYKNSNRVLNYSWGIVCGVVFSIIALILCSQLCLGMKINSTDEVLNENVRLVIKNETNYFGNFWWNVDFSSLTKKVHEKCPEVGLISFSRRGNTLIIDFSSATSKQNELTPNNSGVFANYDGIVSKIFVESGTAMVNVGDTVHIGQMLIAPYMIVGEEKIACEAKGRIYLNIWQSATVEFSETKHEYARTGKSAEVYSLYWQNHQLAKHSVPVYDHYEVEERTIYLSDILPVKMVLTTYYELELIEYKSSFEDEKDGLVFEAREKVLTIINESDIIQEKVTINFLDGIYYVTYYVKTEIEV